MHSNRVKRRIHSSEFKAKVLSECRRPGASVAAVAVANGLNPNIVHKWLSGQGLKRSGLVGSGAAVRVTPPVHFLPVSLAKPERSGALSAPSTPCAHGNGGHRGDLRIEIQHGGLHLNLHGPASAGPTYAALLRALADALGVH